MIVRRERGTVTLEAGRNGDAVLRFRPAEASESLVDACTAAPKPRTPRSTAPYAHPARLVHAPDGRVILAVTYTDGTASFRRLR